MPSLEELHLSKTADAGGGNGAVGGRAATGGTAAGFRGGLGTRLSDFVVLLVASAKDRMRGTVRGGSGAGAVGSAPPLDARPAYIDAVANLLVQVTEQVLADASAGTDADDVPTAPTRGPT